MHRQLLAPNTTVFHYLLLRIYSEKSDAALDIVLAIRLDSSGSDTLPIRNDSQWTYLNPSI